MVSSFPRILIFLMIASLHAFAEDMQKNREREAARAVIMRTVPSLAASPEKLHLETIEKEDGYDVFETKASGGVLTIRGSSGTALCRGFYDFLKTNHLGMVSWETRTFAGRHSCRTPRRAASFLPSATTIISMWSPMDTRCPTGHGNAGKRK